jgi:DNA-binding transcriptional ArsR family regulator
MSVILARRVKKRRRELGLRLSDVALLVDFIDLATKQNLCISKSINDLVDYVGYSERTIRRSLQSLRDNNLLFKVRDFSPKERIPNIYKVNIEVLQDYAREGVR